MVGLAAYLGYVFVQIPGQPSGTRCEHVQIAIVDSLHAGFINSNKVEQMLRKSHLYPVGLLMDSVSSKRIEDALEKDAFINDAICYKTPGGQINIVITQRIPILRIMSDNGEDYYLDSQGYKMKPQGYEADLVVVTGQVSDAYAQKYLVPLGRLIRGDEFWDNQLEQIHVQDNQEILIFTRIGDHVISAGHPQNMDKKLHNLRVFYDRVLCDVGWNRYKDISIAYDNQVVCKKN